MNLLRTEGRIYSVGSQSERANETLYQVLSEENYVLWDAPLPGLYVPQTNEIQLLHHSSLDQCTVLTMGNPKEIHHWGLRLSRVSKNTPIFSAYIEPNGYWVIKLFINGKPRWKSRNEEDHEVPYPIPLISEENVKRSLEENTILKGHQQDNGMGEDGDIATTLGLPAFLNFWGLPVVLPDDHRRRELIWLNKESPLVVNRMKERA